MSSDKKKIGETSSKSKEEIDQEKRIKENSLKERIIIRHPETLSNLSCIDSIIFSVDGVLTTGSTKIMAVTTLNKSYFLDAIDTNEKFDDLLDQYGNSKSKNHDFTSSDVKTQDELS
jgi:hypothetical protein